MECATRNAVANEAVTIRKRPSPNDSRDDSGNPPAKRRVLTTARREQNRLAQKAYRERQKQERIRLKQEKAQAARGQRLRPLLKRDDVPPKESPRNRESSQMTPQTCGQVPTSPEEDVENIDWFIDTTRASQNDLNGNSRSNFPDLYLNMLQFTPTAIFTSCLANAASLGFDLSRIADCSVEHISPFYQPSLSTTLDHTALVQAGSTILSSFNNTKIPVHLRPTMAQILIPHHISLDLIPLPFLRERAIMLSAAMPHLFNNWELKLDIYDKGGLTIWKLKHERGLNGRDSYPPWDMKSWEAAPWFLKKWCMLMGKEYDKLYNQSIGWQVVRDMICSRDILQLING
ncbi:hypothetical protein NW764_016186 [Fusarium oxysporum]|nr:hypothetical protein NW764_016186 [Fusarium oxysporum]